MHKITEAQLQLNGIAPMLRLITPILTGIILVLLTFVFNDVGHVKTNMTSINAEMAVIKFQLKNLPPKWLVRDVEDLKIKCKNNMDH